MENRLNDIDELIGKYLAGEASPEESRQLMHWADSSQTNAKYLEQFRVIFDKAASIRETIDVDTDAAWNKLKSRMGNEAKVVKMTPDHSRNLFWKIAASILVIVSVGIAYQMWMAPADQLEVIAETNPVRDTLPDGSNVVLNKKTQLSYTFEKKKKEHTVKLQGEAYFNVHHEEDEKFIVEVDGILIRDIGTSFNVKAYPESNTIEVTVDEGEVHFYTSSDTGINLKAGGRGIYDKKTKKFDIKNPEPNTAAYASRVFIFMNTNLGVAIDQLNKVYDKKIVVPDSLRSKKTLNVTFNNEPIDSIASVINDTFCLTLKKTDKEFILSGTGCATE